MKDEQEAHDCAWDPDWTCQKSREPDNYTQEQRQGAKCAVQGQVKEHLEPVEGSEDSLFHALSLRILLLLGVLGSRIGRRLFGLLLGN